MSLIVELSGGLGNQMFQYAFAKAYAEKNRADVMIGTYQIKHRELQHKNNTLRDFELSVFNLSLDEYPPGSLYLCAFHPKNMLQRTLGMVYRKIFAEYQDCTYPTLRAYVYDKSLLQPIRKRKFIFGFFQCPQYFESIRQVLLRDFSLNRPLSDNSQQVLNEIRQAEHAVSIHIRRGDYLYAQTTFNIVPDTYYRQGIAYLKAQLGENCKFFVFSDEVDEAKKIFNGDNFYFVEGNTGSRSYEDMVLMSECDHNIIANSSFSWWGGYLNRNPKKIVIAPRRWLADEKLNSKIEIYPQNWIII